MCSEANMVLLPEPNLEFRYGQEVADPRDGLSLFGPYDADSPAHPRNIVYGAIGTGAGLERLGRWSKSIVQPVLTEMVNEDGSCKYDVRNWPHFPGFEATFDCSWPEEPAWAHELDGRAVLLAARDRDAHKRAARLVDMYLEGIDRAGQRDEDFGLLVCVVPDIIWENCRPLSEVMVGVGAPVSSKDGALRAAGPGLFDSYNPDDYRRSVDFRRQLKARAMSYGIPIQLIKESTLEPESSDSTGLRKDSPHSAVAWFLSTALYYKAGGRPWRLCSAREGVCYVGFAFRQAGTGSTRKRTACCAAQMFLDTGDGIVFKGEFGPWYSPETKECHLSKDAAEALLSGVLETYANLGGAPLKEVFLHSRSAIYREEFAGYHKACPSDVALTGIRVRRDNKGMMLFRPGKLPVLRGTCVPLSDRTCYLWSSGFKPRLETYDGFDVPHPLRIDIQHGSADIMQVAEDILGLTKLNYNTCRLGETQPVTIGFSDKVGEILVTNPTVEGCRPQFKFYI